MDQDSVHMMAASKVPMLKPGEYELWRMRMEQYIQMVDYSLWEVIENEKAQRRLMLKARSTLLMGIPNEHQLKFNSIKDAKSLLQAIEKRFKVNAATKKTQRNLLKQHTSSTNGAVNTAYGVTTASTQATAVNSTIIDNLKEMDLRWQMAMLTMRAKRFLKNTRRKLTVNSNETIGFDKSKVECYNCHKRGHFARECRALRNQENRNKENTRRVVPVETTTSNALISCDDLGDYDWRDQSEEGPTNFALMAYSSKSSNFKVSTNSNCLESVEARLLVYKKNKPVYEEDIKLLKRYNVVPPPYTGNFMPPKPDLSFSGLEEFVNEPITSVDLEISLRSSAHSKSLNHPCCEVLPPCDVETSDRSMAHNFSWIMIATHSSEACVHTANQVGIPASKNTCLDQVEIPKNLLAVRSCTSRPSKKPKASQSRQSTE
ncbi:ribonuclease H-like domain-containing protein [Tanacetum coccineum]